METALSGQPASHDAEVTRNNIADAEGAHNAQVISIGENCLMASLHSKCP